MGLELQDYPFVRVFLEAEAEAVKRPSHVAVSMRIAELFTSLRVEGLNFDTN
ncbi:hypothetical protein D3C78_1013860 [compost metagenome]